jgi:5'-nucleotidase
VGLVEQEWLDTLANINPEEVTFLDFVEAGRKLGAQLKQEVRLLQCLRGMDFL